MEVKKLPEVKTQGDIYACKDDNVTLGVEDPSNDSNISYIWQEGNNTIATSHTTTLAVAATTTYTVTKTEFHDVGNGFTCSNTATQKVIIKEGPSITMTPDTSVCEGDYITLTATSPSSTFQWKDLNSRNSSVTVQISKDTTFSVTATKNGCNETSSVNIKKLDLPTLKAEVITGRPNDNTICYNTQAKLETQRLPAARSPTATHGI